MQRAPNGMTAEWLGRRSCLTAGLSSGSTHDFSEAESSTPLCRLTGCHLESTFSTDVIIQYLKGNSKTPMQDGTPSGLWKVYCLATSVYCSSQLLFFFCCKYLSKQVCLDFFFFLYPFKTQTNKRERLQNPELPCNRMHGNSYGSVPQNQPCIHHHVLP